MSKRKRNYPQEIEDAAKRIGNEPEVLQSARNSLVWRNFLTDSLNINSAAVESEQGNAFWENVRMQTLANQTPFTVRQLAEANVEVAVGLYRDAKGHFTKEKTDRPVVSYRSKETGKFVSPKTIDK